MESPFKEGVRYISTKFTASFCVVKIFCFNCAMTICGIHYQCRYYKRKVILMAIGLWQVIGSTDLISKLVLLSLLGMSIGCWALAVYKYLSLRAKMIALKQAQALLQNVKTIDDFISRMTVMQDTFAGVIITGFLTDFKKMLRLYDNNKAIADTDWYLFQTAIQQRVDDALAEEDALTIALTTAAQASPLLGLFGTVWGLIHSFMAIAEQRSADISAVAPGIAEALTTTLAGLLVAIPALILFSYLQSNMRKFEQKLIELADTCTWLMRSMVGRAEVQPPFAARSVEKEIG